MQYSLSSYRSILVAAILAVAIIWVVNSSLVAQAAGHHHGGSSSFILALPGQFDGVPAGSWVHIGSRADVQTASGPDYSWLGRDYAGRDDSLAIVEDQSRDGRAAVEEYGGGSAPFGTLQANGFGDTKTRDISGNADFHRTCAGFRDGHVIACGFYSTHNE